MATCPGCSGPVRETARFCDRCGAHLSTDENAPTIATPERLSRSRNVARFVPGTVLDGRYRIVAPVGRGGMGEVYRADDLKLGQPVALKFLPQSMERDPERLELLLDEVKGARQVSHPNVCRVWDVGEADGLHFVAMEYVDGEDLGSLLRRIGRLPEDRGVQVAREICAGLAAIHDQGLVHRDLKPSNVMLDGRGHARITDFGLAAHADTIVGGDVRSGTPAYMAPETLEGREVTARSDIYSLGLLLYELFTGRYAFSSGPTPKRRDSESRPEMPSSLVRAMDPVVERAILRCLETDPAERPSSALAVAQALPGGDPLAAAMSIGETPSPGMVAAAGGVGGLSALAAVACLAFSVAAVVGVLVLSEARGLPFGPDDKSYAALQDRAGELMRAMGNVHPGDQVADGFSRVTGTSPAAPGAARSDVFYWQRRSPTVLLPVFEERIFRGGSRFSVPALDVPGEAAARLDLQGRLLEFRRFPSTGDTATGAPDWGPLLSAAGLTAVQRIAAAPLARAPVPTDAQQAWLCTTPQGDRRIEGGTFRGGVTFFSVGPHYSPPAVKLSDLIGGTIISTVFLLLFAMSMIVARRNLMVGRADLRGALRIGGAVWLIGSLGFGLFSAPRVSWPGSIFLFQVGLGLFFTTFIAMSYLALEPIVRRRRPQWLASWSRLLDGRWLDPLVGRHVVIGTMAGLTVALISCLRGYLARTAAIGDFQAAAVGGWTALGVVFRGVNAGMELAFVFTLILVLLQLAVRKDRFAFVAWIVWALLFTALQPPATLGLVGFPLSLLQAVVMGLVLHRFGVLPLVVAIAVMASVSEEYLTIHLGAWYSGVTIAALLTIAMLLAWGIAAACATRGVPERRQFGGP